MEMDDQSTCDSATPRATSSQSDPFPGMQLGPWRLLEPLGQGGMGAVWLAERADAAFEMRVAVKLIRAERSSEALQARFRRERQILADLKHPNICGLLDGGTTPSGLPYLVMEYLEGDTIDQWCRTRQPGLRQVLEVFRTLCVAVTYAHGLGVLHRDIKPSNIMISPTGSPKLLDFGIATHTASSSPRLTDLGGEPMTPEFAAPELMLGQRASTASDVYSLGLVLFYLLTGKRPRQAGGKPAGQLRSFAVDERERALLDQVADLLERVLEGDPANRLDSAEVVANRIDRILAGKTDRLRPPQQTRYDALLWCHTESRERVVPWARRLEEELGLVLWFESASSEPVAPTELAEKLAACACLVVIKGEGEPWLEPARLQAVHHQYRNKPVRVVPVLLPGAEHPTRESDLPIFLRRRPWISLDAHVESLIETARAIRGGGLAAGAPGSPETCPFRGLKAFREEDRDFFFGREAMVQRLNLHMERFPFLALLGPSGSGKSSVIHAGLVPLLRERGHRIASFTPASNPIEECALALCSLLAEDGGSATDLANLRSRLTTDPEGLHRVLAEAAGSTPRTGFILIVDQFEELFTQTRDRQATDHFLAILLHAVERRTLAVILTMRSDFLGECAGRPDLNSFVGDHMVLLPMMDREALSQAVVEPASRTGLHFETGLVEKILDDVHGEAGNLPLLEHALLELYERRRGKLLTAAAYHGIGGIEGALTKRAEAVFQNLTPAGQIALRKMFTLCLVHRNEAANVTRRRSTRAALIAAAEDRALAEDLLHQFVSARLWTTWRDEIRGGELVDVAHEALIRKWERIRTWMAEDREIIRRLSNLRQLAARWQEAGRPRDDLPRGNGLFRMLEVAEHRLVSLGEVERAFLAEACKQRDLRKNQILAVSVSGFLLALIATVLFFQARSANQRALREQARARQAQKVAEQRTRQSNYNLAEMFNRAAGESLEQGKAPEALLFALAALSRDIPSGSAVPEALGRFADARMIGAESLLYTSPVAPEVLRVAFAPGDELLAMACTDHKIRLLDARTGRAVGTFSGHVDEISDMAFSSDGSLLASVAMDRTIRLWHLADGHDRTGSGTEHRSFEMDFPLRNVAFLSGDRNLLVRDSDGLLHELALDEDKPQVTPYGFTSKDSILAVDGLLVLAGKADWNGSRNRSRRFLPAVFDSGSDPTKRTPLPKRKDPKLIAVTSARRANLIFGSEQSGRIVAWDVNSGDVNASLEVPAMVTSMAVDAQGRLLAACDERGSLNLWRVPAFSPIEVNPGDGARAGAPRSYRSVAVNERGDLLAAATESGECLVWQISDEDVARGRLGAPRALLGHRGEVENVVFSPGRRLVAALGDRGVKVLEVETGRERWLPATAVPGRGLDFSHDGQWLAAGYADGVVRIWRMADSEVPISFEGHAKAVQVVAFSPDGAWLASGSADRTVNLWDVRTGNLITTFRGHEKSVKGLAFTPDGTFLISSSDDHHLKFWDLETRALSRTVREEVGRLLDVAVSPNGDLLAIAGSEETIAIRSLPSGDRLFSLPGHSARILDVAFSPDGALLASGSYDQTIGLWQMPSGEPLPPLSGHASAVNGVAFSPDGELLASVSVDKTLRLWKRPSAQADAGSLDHSSDVFGVACAPDGRLLATASGERRINLWRLPEATLVGSLEGHHETVWGLAFSPDGRLLASAGFDHMVRLWPLPAEADSTDFSAVTSTMLRGHESPVYRVAFSPDGATLASCSYDRTVRLWHVASGRQLFVLSDFGDPVRGVAFSPDGSLLASASKDRTIQIHDPVSGKRVRRLTGQSPFYDVAISPDGSMLAAAGAPSIKLWRLPEFDAPRSFTAGKTFILGVTFSADSRRLISAHGDKSVCVWDLSSGKLLATLSGHGNEVNQTAFVPGSGLLASASDDRRVLLWHLDKVRFFERRNYDQVAFASLFQNALTHFNFRLDGFRLVPEPRFGMLPISGAAASPSRSSHLGRPVHAPLYPWLEKGDSGFPIEPPERYKD
ncbi:Non-specific serine/threonine protein kinase [Sulfidibacter corallicola]